MGEPVVIPLVQNFGRYRVRRFGRTGSWLVTKWSDDFEISVQWCDSRNEAEKAAVKLAGEEGGQ